MSDLAAKTCVPCRGGVPPLKGENLSILKKQVDTWNIIEEHHIMKTFKFANFREALKFETLQAVGAEVGVCGWQR
jgi:4a-hydroxytetrahydrobiopterin dehydratase